jgi:SAM-dependent methyltransferase
MTHEDAISRAPYVSRLSSHIVEKFPYFRMAVPRQLAEFGSDWLDAFEVELATFFVGNPDALRLAAEGYGRFALDAMRLQKLFDRDRCYIAKTYAEAASEVYQNRDYMFSLYLPGILLSHYLWPHHYRQHRFFANELVPLMRQHGGDRFYDVGVGTGFYSKEYLRALPNIRGDGFDLSPFSLEHTLKMVSAWAFEDRYTTNLRNIITEPVGEPAPFVLSIEVLEHLEEPQSFLDALCRMMEPGGYGFISAAMTAPNADHIYLYNEAGEVAAQLERAGFQIVKHVEDPAYEPRHAGDSVPRNVAFIVTR